MDESIYTVVKRMLNVRAGKTSVERKPKVMGGRIRKQETVPWKRQAERMQGSHAGSIHLAGGGARGDSGSGQTSQTGESRRR